MMIHLLFHEVDDGSNHLVGLYATRELAKDTVDKILMWDLNANTFILEMKLIEEPIS